jgi:filamentous hemagglutinin family protein
VALPKVSLAFVAACVFAAAVPRVALAQHITIDGRLSATQTLVGPYYSIGANLGKQVGSNLFHSFGQFGLSNRETAAFSGPPTINNVISRVTGGNPSSIDGTIKSKITGANLFLINPSGIFFGPNAKVNVSGAFHASTADYIKMSDGAKFQATHPDGSTLSAAPPAAFGFLNAAPAAITVNGSKLEPGPAPLGSAPANLGLVGGPVSIAGATLSAPAGAIHVTSAAGTGEVPVGPRNKSALTMSKFGPVDIKGGSTFDVSDAQNKGTGGSVFIRSGALTIDASEINADNYGSSPGGKLALRGENQVSLSNGANVHAATFGSGSGAGVMISTAASGVISADTNTMVLTDTSGSGNGGTLLLKTGRMTVTNGANVSAQTSGASAGGELKVKVGGLLTVDSGAFLGALASNTATKNAGNVTVTAGSLNISNSGLIGSFTEGQGDASNVAVSAGELIILNNGLISSQGVSEKATGGVGDVKVSVTGQVLIDGTYGNRGGETGIFSVPNTRVAGHVKVTAGSLSILNSGEISSGPLGLGSGTSGNVTVGVARGLLIDGTVFTPDDVGTGIFAQNNGGTGAAGVATVTAGSARIVTNGEISSSTFGSGAAGKVSVHVNDALVIDGTGATVQTGVTTQANAGSSGNAGSVAVYAGVLKLVAGGSIVSVAKEAGNTGVPAAKGNAGDVMVSVDGRVAIDGSAATTDLSGKPALTGISTNAEQGTAGNAGNVMLTANGAIALSDGSLVSSSTAGAGKGGTVRVSAQGPLTLSDSRSGIVASASSTASGDAGSVTVRAPQISVTTGAEIASTTTGTGGGGSVDVMTPGALVLDGQGIAGTQIAASATGPQSGGGGPVTVTAGSLSVMGAAQIASSTAGLGKGGDVAVTVMNGATLAGSGSGITASASSTASGDAGSVRVNAPQIAITSGAEISSTTAGTGAGGAVDVTTPDALVLDGQGVVGTQIAASTTGLQSGPGGSVTVAANSLSLAGGAQIASTTAGPGNGGVVQVTAQGPLTLTDPASGIIALATSTASGNAGSVTVTAPEVSVATGAEIASTTAGTGAGGSVMVTTPGALVLAGADAQIAASATGLQSGPGGSVTVAAGGLAVSGGALIASTTAGLGSGGDVGVTVANGVTLSGVGPDGASGITASAEPGSRGQAGEIMLIAGGKIALSGGAKATSSTAGAGNGGSVRVTAQGPLSLSDPGSGIIASAASTASGNAGSVRVNAPQITLTTGAEIASTTAGTGAGGSVMVTTPGALVLDGAGVASTQIAASATGPLSGAGGSVSVAADTVTVKRGARIASTTVGPGKGGDINVTVASDIVLPDPGPQITAQSTGSGDAGSITVSTARLLMSNGAAISNQAETSIASGGNVTLKVRDFLYLTSSEITTSVKGETGSGGNITIDPQLVILNHSSIIAQAVEGHGGKITINAGLYVASTDSIVSASSQLGISGMVLINGPQVDVNSALVVLSSELRGRVAVLREACAARADRPISSLVEAGSGGLPQDPEATIPALYIADSDFDPNTQPRVGTNGAGGSPLRTTVRLTMPCG